MTLQFIGKSLPRTEDARLLTGLGHYTADVLPADRCRLYVVRSPHAAARIRSIDTAAAEAGPGVLKVLTGESPELRDLGTFSSRVPRKAPDGKPNFVPPYRALARERVQFVGDAVAAVYAETLDQAKDAAELLEIEYEPLPAITVTRHATDADAPLVWSNVPRNACFLHEEGNRAGVDAALKRAAHVVELTLDINRIIAAPMEPRAALAAYDRGTESWTLWAPLQAPHGIRQELAAQTFKVAGNRIRVISPEVGGGFGLKGQTCPEYVLAMVGARATGRPVYWVCERSESFACDNAARDNYSKAKLALDKNGTFLALDIETVANIGAYISHSGLHPPVGNLGGLSGVYRTPAIAVRVTGAFTNTPPTAPYRGAGRPEATYVLERTIDYAARTLGFDPVDLRRRNLIAPDQLPYDTGFVFKYDSGEFGKNMEDVLKLADWDGFGARRKAAAARGKLAGIGIANAIEIAGGPVNAPMSESGAIVFDATGAATVTLGTHSHGQGHEITFKQILGDMLGLAPEMVKVRYGDTDLIEHGTGTFGSRSAAAAGVLFTELSRRIIERGKAIAAAHLEADPGDIEFSDGMFSVAGTDKRVSLQAVAKLSFVLKPPELGGEFGLAARTIMAPNAPTFPNGCHVCEVEIDPDTGRCEIVRYAIVDDVGRMINPMLVHGQIRGGVAQGVGQVLLENMAYDEDGQLLSGSFMDYAMPRADDFPQAFPCESNEVPTAANPLGVKGAGEAGAVGALPAVVNAVVDALTPLGIKHVDMPITPDRLWQVIQAAKKA